VPMNDVPAQYPGLYLFSAPSRLMRPVMHLAKKQIEMIGTFEQIFMDICIKASEAYPGVGETMDLPSILCPRLGAERSGRLWDRFL